MMQQNTGWPETLVQPVFCVKADYAHLHSVNSMRKGQGKVGAVTRSGRNTKGSKVWITRDVEYSIGITIGISNGIVVEHQAS